MQTDEEQKALVRFAQPADATAALQPHAEGKVVIGDNAGTAVLVEGDAEKEIYLRKVAHL